VLLGLIVVLLVLVTFSFAGLLVLLDLGLLRSFFLCDWLHSGLIDSGGFFFGGLSGGKDLRTIDAESSQLVLQQLEIYRDESERKE
jgi:hypothetical protein